MRPEARSCAPQVEEERCHIDHRLVHEIACKAGRKLQSSRDTIKDAGFCDPSVETTSLVFGLVVRGDNVAKIPSVVYRIRVREVGRVDIRVRGSPVVFVIRRSQEGQIIMRTLNLVAAD